MLDRMVLVLSAMLLAAPATAAPKVAKQAKEECPTLNAMEIEELLEKAPSCDRGMALFRICAFGSNADTGFSSAVTDKCEADFLEKLPVNERKGYAAKVKRCNDKYARKEGSMYVSASAFCRAEVAQQYSRKALKNAGRK